MRDLTGTEAGRERLTIGAGGDRTAVVDRAAEDAVLRACDRLQAAGTAFRLISEEIGERSYGAEFPLLVVDPVDGSLNAMQGIPYYCTALTVLEGPSLGDAVAGVVRNLAGSSTFTAVRGAGVERDGRPLHPLAVALGRTGRIPVLLVEAFREFGRAGVGDEARLAPLLRHAGRVRLLGSSAMSLCLVASGGASALVAPDGMRPWDCAAGLLMLRELGAVVTDLAGRSVDGAPLEIGRRTPLVASLDPDVHARVLELLG